jgi:hypothetical protein
MSLKPTCRTFFTISATLGLDLDPETNVLFGVVGIEGKGERILRSNAQLSRLFAAHEILEPVNGETRRRAFAKFVEYVETAIRMPLTPARPRDELIRRLHYATDGVVGNLMNLLRYAALVAQQEKREVLELPTLSRAFQSRLSKHLRQKVNPIDTPLDQTFVIPAPSANGASGPPESRRGGRKSRASLGEALRAR